jgi:hypothetical protein
VARSHQRVWSGPPAVSNDRVPILFSEAVTRQQAGRHADATTLYHQILMLDPGLPEANCNMGVALAGLGDWIPLRHHHFNNETDEILVQ